MHADPRATRSREALLAAVTTFLDAGDVPSITDVVAAAGVSRPTLYQHFGDIPTLCTTAAVERVRQQFAEIGEPAPAAADRDFACEAIGELLTHLDTHRTFYRTVLHEAGTRELTDRFVELIAARIIRVSPLGARLDPDSAADRDRVGALAAGLLWLIIRWLDDAEPAAIEATAERVLSIMTSFLSPRTEVSA